MFCQGRELALAIAYHSCFFMLLPRSKHLPGTQDLSLGIGLSKVSCRTQRLDRARRYKDAWWFDPGFRGEPWHVF